jgi:DNA replication protein DnaC
MAKDLKLDATTEEVACFAQDNNLSYNNIYYIHKFFKIMDERKHKHIVEQILNLSRLPMKHPCTFDNFDFTRFHGHEADELENLQTLSMLEALHNLLLVGSKGVGKTHLAIAIGHKCCEKGLKTYFLKISELNDKFKAALQDEQGEKIIRRLVKPTCLIIDEFGYCDFKFQQEKLASFL